jgi:alpha-glucosidase
MDVIRTCLAARPGAWGARAAGRSESEAYLKVRRDVQIQGLIKRFGPALLWAAASLVVLLGVAACDRQGAATPMPPGEMVTIMSPQPMDNAVATPSPSPTATAAGKSQPAVGQSQPAAGKARPALDVFAARLATGPGGQATPTAGPFLGGLAFWNRNGRRVDAGELLAATILQTNSQGIRRADWSLATQGGGGMTLSVAAEQVAEGILSVVITPSRPSGVEALGFCLPAKPDEHFYGLGERFDHFNLAGQVIKNQTAEEAGLRTTYAPAPFLLSSRGYGLYVETMAQATFDLRTGGRGCYLVRVAGSDLHLYFFGGPDPRTVVARHARLVGLPPLPPSWAFGVWKNLIGGQDRVLQDLGRLRDAGVPLDAVWIYDAVVERAGFGWPWQIYGPIPPGSYPDIPGLIDRLHGMDLKVLGYLNPFLYPKWAGYDEARQKGYLVQTANGQPYLQTWTFGQRAHLDFTNPQAARWWQDRVRYALSTVGFDGAMLDFGEDAPVDGRYAGVSSGSLMDNMYPVLYHRAAYEAGQAAKPGNFVFFARAGYSGSQRYSTGRFTGDQTRSWSDRRGLRSVIPAVLNGSLSGWPYWGPDIAGFFQGKEAVKGPGEKELWIRWTEVGAMMPTMRDMYGAMKDPVSLFTDDETLSVFRTYATLHTALKPYLYRYARIAHEQGVPIVRPLFLNYPDKAETYALQDQYLLGDDLLVAPVLEPGQTQRTLYLPAGHWRFYWTGEVHEGGRRVTVPAPLHEIPLFVREGADVGLPPAGQVGN